MVGWLLFSGTRYRSEWTTNIGLSFKKIIGKNLYLQAGPAYIFLMMAAELYLGLTLGGGYEVEVGDRLVVPLGFRVEPVFGNAVPISCSCHSGIHYLW